MLSFIRTQRRNIDGDGAPLDFRNVAIRADGNVDVEFHLNRFAENGVMASREAGMLDRLKRIEAGELEATDFDRAFYTHELRELELYRDAGFPTGQPLDADQAYDLWDQLHTRALEDYGLTRTEALEALFHPEVR